MTVKKLGAFFVIYSTEEPKAIDSICFYSVTNMVTYHLVIHQEFYPEPHVGHTHCSVFGQGLFITKSATHGEEVCSE